MTNKKLLEKIAFLPQYLKKRIIGQDHVIDAFAEKISYAERGIANPQRPKACFFLLGPTGTGKTELVRETVKYFYGDPDKNLLRLDMSEFGKTAGEDVGAKLIGHDANNPGRLYHFLESTTEGAILYDEFEKAHPDLAKYMLQQLDAAHVTLFNGKTYNLSNYYLFFTSNIAADIFQGNTHLSLERKVDAAVNELKRRFGAPEFVARFGKFGYGIMAFKALQPDHLRMIARKFLTDDIKRFADIKNNNPRHPDNMIVKGYSPAFIEKALLQINSNKNGAREIRDVIERMIYHAYSATFTTNTIGVDQAGYLDIVNGEPILVQECKNMFVTI